MLTISPFLVIDDNTNINNERARKIKQDKHKQTRKRAKELDFLTYLLIDVKPWSFVREFELSMQLVLMTPLVIHRGSLLTSSCIECCHSCLPLPTSLGPLFCPELMNSIMHA